MTEPPRILFVDDEPRVLDGLRRMLHRQRETWTLDFVTSGSEALSAMDRAAYDIVVTDLRMPGMDGADLLARVMHEHPDTIRFVLSGYSQRESAIRAAGTAHQFLNKPCEAAQLRTELGRALRLRQQLHNAPLRRAVSRMNSLPSLPQLYREICEVAQSPSAGMNDIADVVAKDMGMSAKVLQLVNSSFFALPREVSNVRQAVSLAGVDVLKSLVLTTDLFRSLELPRGLRGFSQDSFWRHCTECGMLARRIVEAEGGSRQMGEHALTAGLLHDVGKLILAVEAPESFQRSLSAAQETRTALQAAEQERGGVSHVEVGFYLLGLWHLPLSVLEAVAFHHAPAESGTQVFNATAAVHAANVLIQEHRPGESGNGAVPELHADWLASLGLQDRPQQWRQIAQTAGARGA